MTSPAPIATRVQFTSEFYGCPSGMHGGNTVSHDHTSAHYRNELPLSPFFDAHSYSLDPKRFEKARSLLAEEKEPPLTPEAIDEIVAEARRDLSA